MITGVILARNEQRNILDCLECLKPHVSEILLIDMQSEDATVKIAEPIVDKVLTHPKIANFDSARNIAIEESSNEWLWFVDADERVSKTTADVVHELINNNESEELAAINIPFKTYFCGQWMQHCGWWPGYTMPRVLKKGHFRFNEALHSGVSVDGTQIFVSPNPEWGVDHYSYESVNHYLRKANQYTSTEAKTLAEQTDRFDWQLATKGMMNDLWQYYERNDGKLDGGRGWILSWLSGQYRWLTHAKLIDEIPREDVDSCPNDLDEVLNCMRGELTRLRKSSPVFPLGIRWRSPLFDPSGYAEDARTSLKALASTSRTIQAREIRWSDQTCKLTTDDKALYDALTRCEPAKSFISVATCIPTLVEPDPEATINVLRTTFETDRIPAYWLERLEMFDQIWVFSKHSRDAFVRSGVALEKLRVIPQFIDTNIFSQEGECLQLPEEAKSDFVFLSIFDWQLRKGWDVLLKAYCKQFSADDNVTLLLKVTGQHGKTPDSIQREADSLLATIHQSLELRPDIQFLFDPISTSDLASLYRACDAFVLPTRGEGWGRPIMEAMSCGLPVICTNASGNSAFANSENCRVIDSTLVPVSPGAVAEIPVYAGHNWLEPDEQSLREAMQDSVDDNERSQALANNALEQIAVNFSLKRGSEILESAITEIEQLLQISKNFPTEANKKPNVVLEGELFASHSFSNINELLTKEFVESAKVNFSVNQIRQMGQVSYNPLDPRLQVKSSIGNHKPEVDVTIRHAFPPNFQKPDLGAWVHIQPWEFGPLPSHWIAPLKDQVDEIWAPSNYVKECYLESGIGNEKVKVIPWGIQPEIFNDQVVPRLLPTEREFCFIYVGGTIRRKGFDRVLQAYLEEFSCDESVCLVVKDVGTNSFYRYGNLKDQVTRHAEDHSKPEILYTDQDMTPNQVASLYAACDCLVAPYRGEGFGMPILEGMACGLPVIVPQGGPTDDFVTEETGFLLPSEVVRCKHDWELCGEPTEIAIEIGDLRAAMRKAFSNRQETQIKGALASKKVCENFTWRHTVEKMTDRIDRLGADQKRKAKVAGDFSVAIASQGNESQLVATLVHNKSLVGEVVVLNLSENPRINELSNEYGVKCIDATQVGSVSKIESLMAFADQFVNDWLLYLHEGEWISERGLKDLHDYVKTQSSPVIRLKQQDGASEIRLGNRVCLDSIELLSRVESKDENNVTELEVEIQSTLKEESLV